VTRQKRWRQGWFDRVDNLGSRARKTDGTLELAALGVAVHLAALYEGLTFQS
jgi:hypothetical protein